MSPRVHPGPVTGGSDCEAIATGLLSQPVAALSSVAFVVAAGWLWTRRPPSGPERFAATAYASLVGLVGVGSVLYHGPRGSASELIHDGSIALVLSAAVVVPLSRALRGTSAFRPGAARLVRVAGVTAGVGVVVYLLGRTGGRLCDPESLVQPHALWHVLMAGALAAWGAMLWASHPRGTDVR